MSNPTFAENWDDALHQLADQHLITEWKPIDGGSNGGVLTVTFSGTILDAIAASHPIPEHYSKEEAQNEVIRILLAACYASIGCGHDHD